jgi:hypothetical protein
VAGGKRKITWTYSVVIVLEEGLGLIMSACIANMAATIIRQWINRPARKKKTPSIQVTNKINAVVNKILFIVAILYSIDKIVPVCLLLIKRKNRRKCSRFFLFILLSYTLLLADRPKISETINKTRKIKNNILAMEAAPAAMPPNPKMAAMIATIRNITVQRNIVYSFMVIKIVSGVIGIPSHIISFDQCVLLELKNPCRYVFARKNAI